MAIKTITVREEAYERLKVLKGEGESFSDIILRITGKAKLSDFAGLLSDKEAEELEERILESRKKSSARMKRIARNMGT